MLNIGERLKEERARLGHNQADFAALAGVSKTTQFNYEKGERSPDAEYLAAAAVQGVDVLYVVTSERTPQAADRLTAEETTLLKHYRELPDADRAGAAKMISALAAMAGNLDRK